jgi:hypothetical protein
MEAHCMIQIISQTIMPARAPFVTRPLHALPQNPRVQWAFARDLPEVFDSHVTSCCHFLPAEKSETNLPGSRSCASRRSSAGFRR